MRAWVWQGCQCGGGNGVFGGSCGDPPLEDLPGHFGAALGFQDRWWVLTGGGRSGGDVVLPVLGETQEGARGESVPRSLPLHAATKLAHVGPHVHLGRAEPAAEIGGVLPGTRAVGGVAQTAALTARVEAFWLRWEKDARSDMSRKVEAAARKLAKGEGLASESCARKNSSIVVPEHTPPGRWTGPSVFVGARAPRPRVASGCHIRTQTQIPVSVAMLDIGFACVSASV